jgi:hypothetical protein
MTDETILDGELLPDERRVTPVSLFFVKSAFINANIIECVAR